MLAKITLGISRNKRKFKQNTSNTDRVLCSCLSNDSEKDKNVRASDKHPSDMEPIDWQAEGAMGGDTRTLGDACTARVKSVRPYSDTRANGSLISAHDASYAGVTV